jgi:alpha-L-fucosidase
MVVVAWCGIVLTAVTARAAEKPAALDGTSAEMWGAGGGAKTNLARGAWLKDSRFAMFVHWGLYSDIGGKWDGKTHYGIAEWIMRRAKIPVADYEKVADRFNPTGFDAKEWVQLAKDTGMRHIMITAKHHDGFAMFKSAVHPFNIVDATPFKRDPMKELSEACRDGGLRLGFYYSQTQDWHERDAVGNDWTFKPGEGDFQKYLAGKAVPQIKELLSHYGPIAGVWFDTPGPITPEQSKGLVDLVHALQPQALVNSRIGNGLGDYETLGDQEIPRLPRPGLWETPDTANDTWAYAWYDRNWKSPTEIAERLVRVVSRGGTYMLNVGPDGTGRIPEQSARILREVGKWVHAHEEAIHGTDSTPFGPLAWGECTARGNTLFLHVFQWPADGTLILPGLHAKVKRATLERDKPLAHETGMNQGVTLNVQRSTLNAQVMDEITFEQKDGLLTLRVPKLRPDTLIPVVTLELAGPVEASREAYVLNGCRNTLEMGVAALKGCEVKAVNWMEKFGDWKHMECLVGWQGPERSATWDFKTVSPGSFYLDVEYTCPAEDDYSEWGIRCGDNNLTFPLIDTGERPARKAFGGALPRFRTYRVGVIDFPKPGAQQLTFGPTGADGKNIRVTALRLLPVE